MDEAHAGRATSTVLIIGVPAVVVIAAIVAVGAPRFRARRVERARPAELKPRPGEATEEHLSSEQTRSWEAEVAALRARSAERDASRKLAEADMRSERARRPEPGLADEQPADRRRGGPPGGSV